MHFINHVKKYFLLFALTLVFYSCGVWGNFTTYFNLYYNTKHLFNEAEGSISADRADIFATTEPKIKPADDQKLQKVIEKCSKILQYSPDSRYVDDALIILGKSFYYQQNFLKASREFEELLQTQPDSDLRLEAQLWLGKSQLRLNKTDEGLATIKNVRALAAEQDDMDVLEGALIEEIKFKISTDDIAGAVKSASDFLNISENDELNQKIAFELGRLDEELNNYDDAIIAYQKVLDYSPSYQMELDTKLALGKAYIEGGYNDKAYSLLDDMSSLDKNKDVLDKINLEKGITLAQLGRFNDALDVLTEIDTVFRTSAYAGAARFEIGKLYEYDYNNFDSAAVYYSKASVSLVPPEYAQEVSAKMAKFRKYQDLKTQLKFNNEQYIYALHPEKFVEDSTNFYDKLKEYQQMLADNKNNMENARDNPANRRDRNLGLNETPTNAPILDFTKRPVMPSIPADSIRANIIVSEFELGNLFFTELNRPDSAYYYYNKVLLADPPRTIRANTLFVLGNYFLTKKDSTKADSVFNDLYENFKDQSIVNAAATILKKPLINFDYDPAQQLYSNAEKQLWSKNYRESLDQFKNIYENYPASPRAPKALYASGWVLENELLKPDSAVVFYDTLTTRYPRSEYAVNIAPKLYEYHQEQKRIEKIRADSVKVLEQQTKMDIISSDSTKAIERSIPDEQLKKLPPGLRFEARRDSTNKQVDDGKNISPQLKEARPSLRNDNSREDSLLRGKKNEPADTLRTK